MLHHLYFSLLLHACRCLYRGSVLVVMVLPCALVIKLTKLFVINLTLTCMLFLYSYLSRFCFQCFHAGGKKGIQPVKISASKAIGVLGVNVSLLGTARSSLSGYEELWPGL